MVAGKDTAVIKQRIEALVDDFVNERAFPGPRSAGDANELLERNLDTDVLEVILTSSAHDQRFAVMRTAMFGDANAPFAAQVGTGQRFAVLEDLLQWPF